jgi:hypothetical protein
MKHTLRVTEQDVRQLELRIDTMVHRSNGFIANQYRMTLPTNSTMRNAAGEGWHYDYSYDARSKNWTGTLYDKNDIEHDSDCWYTRSEIESCGAFALAVTAYNLVMFGRKLR